MSDGGRMWPRGQAFDGVLHIDGYALEGNARPVTLPLSELFEHLPVAVLKARFSGAAKPARRRMQMA